MGLNLDQTAVAKVRTAVSGGAQVGATSGVAAPAPAGGVLQAFQGFLKKAGSMLTVALTEVVRYVVPIAQVVSLADPVTAPEVKAFTTAVSLVQTAVLGAQQRWSAEGSAANSQKLADVILLVEQPIVLLFAQAGVSVDTAYVTNLVNGVVAILNAQPGVLLNGAASATAVAAH